MSGWNTRPYRGRRGRSRAGAIALLAVAGVWGATPLAAARAGDSEDLIKQGVEQRRKGDDQKALDLFKRAHAIDHGARSEAQVGLAEQALGIFASAETHLTEALAQKDDPWIKKNALTLRNALEAVASRLGSLEVWGSPPGAEVLVGGTVAGVLPLAAPIRVTAGTVQLSVRAEGFVEVTRVVEVNAGGKVRELVELPRRGARPINVAAAPTPESTEAAPATPVMLRSGHVEPAEGSGSIWKTWWLWTIVGAVAVAGGATAAYLLTRPNDCMAGAKCGTVGP